MSLLGIDVGTSGCKSAVFSERGELLSVAYEEYDMERPQPGWAQLCIATITSLMSPSRWNQARNRTRPTPPAKASARR